MSLAQDIYQKYSDLALTWQNIPGVDKNLLNCFLQGNDNLDPTVKSLFRDSDLNKARDLRAEIEQLNTKRQGPALDPIYLDIYDLALCMRLHSDQLHHPKMWGYRGQRSTWPTEPSILRIPKKAKILHKRELKRRGDLIAAFSKDLERAYPDKYSEDQCVAIAQHYGEKNKHHPKLSTWLLDLTTDPLVALFFASDKGEGQDIGKVTVFGFPEWMFLSAKGSNPFGGIQIIEVPGALRVENQRALFLDTPHPALIEQCAARVYTFQQKPGLLFEDPTMNITKDRIYPSEDKDDLLRWVRGWRRRNTLSQRLWPKLLRWVRDWRRRNTLSQRLWPKLLRISQPLKADDYMEIVESWITQGNNPHNTAQFPIVKKCLRDLCTFHTNLQKGPNIPLDARCIFRLKDATEQILAGDSLEDTVNLVYQERCNDTICTNAVREALAEVEGQGKSLPKG